MSSRSRVLDSGTITVFQSDNKVRKVNCKCQPLSTTSLRDRDRDRGEYFLGQTLSRGARFAQWEDSQSDYYYWAPLGMLPTTLNYTRERGKIPSRAAPAARFKQNDPLLSRWFLLGLIIMPVQQTRQSSRWAISLHSMSRRRLPVSCGRGIPIFSVNHSYLVNIVCLSRGAAEEERILFCCLF